MAPNLRINQDPLIQTEKEQVVLSLLIPFEPRVNAKSKIEATIRRLTQEAGEKLLLQSIEQEKVNGMIEHLHACLETIDYSSPNKSIALKVTPQGARLYYWNMPVHETVLVSNEFPIKQLVGQKRSEKEYLLLAVGDHFGGIYLGNGSRISKLVANSPSHEAHTGSGKQDNPIENSRLKAVRHIDNALTLLRRFYNHPVFVIAPTAYLNVFREVSHNADDAAALIEANPHGNDARLQQLMAPYLDDWQRLKEKGLVQQLEQALQNGKLAVGITEVWTAAAERRGRTLVVEEDYTYPAYLDAKNGILYEGAIPLNKEARKVTDAVCAAIEKVLADGGQVEIVRNGVLSEFVHVAMVCY